MHCNSKFQSEKPFNEWISCTLALMAQHSKSGTGRIWWRRICSRYTIMHKLPRLPFCSTHKDARGCNNPNIRRYCGCDPESEDFCDQCGYNGYAGNLYLGNDTHQDSKYQSSDTVTNVWVLQNSIRSKHSRMDTQTSCLLPSNAR